MQDLRRAGECNVRDDAAADGLVDQLALVAELGEEDDAGADEERAHELLLSARAKGGQAPSTGHMSSIGDVVPVEGLVRPRDERAGR